MTAIKDRLRDAARRMKDIGCLNEAALMLEVAGINERLERESYEQACSLALALASETEAVLRQRITDVESDLAKAREDALEEAAKVCDRIWEQDAGTSGAGSSAACAMQIRALKAKKP